MSFLNFFTEKVKAQGICSIEFRSDGYAIACASEPISARQNILFCDFFPHRIDKQIKDSLNRLVEQYSLFDMDCNIVLPPDFYRLFLLKKPNVPEAEYKSAMRWQVKEMIEFPLEDAVVDIFYPAPEIKHYSHELFVVVAQNSFLVTRAKLLKECHLNPVSVDIREFSIRNLVNVFGNPKETTLVLDMHEKHCLIVFVKEEQVYFSRRVNAGLDSLRNTANQSNLYLEIKRSLAYYQAELKQLKPEKLLFTPKAQDNKLLLENLANELEFHFEMMDLNLLDKQQKMPMEKQEKCFSVCGGIFRKEQQ
ncbi:MAG: hypothetical protein ABIH77_05775 [Pseudomonadota bacterium]|nr:hypothetical protein [Gammaproteobacteria bacterium]MBU1628477.1 hypothetical protein [Gammaproteobacteria bacterium]MBU2545606.1 hypothetical protein [Gammaproteobacteria bacterium]